MSGGWAAETPARAGLLWCDARHIYPPRCQGPCRRTYVQLARDRARLTYSSEHGPVCEECVSAMSQKIDWNQPQAPGDPPLWAVAAELRAAGAAWDAVADEISARYGLNVIGQSCRSVVLAREKRGLRWQDEIGADVPRETATTAGTAATTATTETDDGDDDDRAGEAGEMVVGTSSDVARCHVEIVLPGYYLRAEGTTREELCERLNLGDSILGASGE